LLQVAEQFRRVTERGLLSTEIQTEDRDLVTLPNLHLVTNPVRVVRPSGTIVTAEVSLGDDVHHEMVETLLTAAAVDAGLKDPFVLVMKSISA
jgi:small-conductance mechanosensitive channel